MNWIIKVEIKTQIFECTCPCKADKPCRFAIQTYGGNVVMSIFCNFVNRDVDYLLSTVNEVFNKFSFLSNKSVEKSLREKFETDFSNLNLKTNEDELEIKSKTNEMLNNFRLIGNGYSQIVSETGPRREGISSNLGGYTGIHGSTGVHPGATGGRRE